MKEYTIVKVGNRYYVSVKSAYRTESYLYWSSSCNYWAWTNIGGAKKFWTIRGAEKAIDNLDIIPVKTVIKK